MEFAKTSAYRESQLPLEVWINEQNEESLALTIAEVSTITLGVLGVLFGGLMLLDAATTSDLRALVVSAVGTEVVCERAPRPCLALGTTRARSAAGA